MFGQYMAMQGLSIYPLVAMTIFLLIFAAVLAHTILGRGRDRFMARAANLPLDDEADTIVMRIERRRRFNAR